MSTLAKEIETYKKILPSLLSDQGKFAVVNGDKLIGVYTSYEDAVKIGYQICGLNSPFLVKQISADEKISYFSRELHLPSCHV